MDNAYPNAFLDLGQADDMELTYPILTNAVHPVGIPEILCLITVGGTAHQTELKASKWEEIVSHAESLT